MIPNREERRFQATKRDVAKALLLFRRTIAALKQAEATGKDGVTVVDREVGLKRLDDVLPIIGAVADVADQNILVTARALFRAAPGQSAFPGGVPLESNMPYAPMLAAIEVLKAMDRSGAPRAAEAAAGRPPDGLGWRHAQLMAWLDENCGFGCLVGYLHNE